MSQQKKYKETSISGYFRHISAQNKSRINGIYAIKADFFRPVSTHSGKSIGVLIHESRLTFHHVQTGVFSGVYYRAPSRPGTLFICIMYSLTQESEGQSSVVGIGHADELFCDRNASSVFPVLERNYDHALCFIHCGN